MIVNAFPDPFTNLVYVTNLSIHTQKFKDLIGCECKEVTFKN